MENQAITDLPRKRCHSDKKKAPVFQDHCEVLKKVRDIIVKRTDEVDKLLTSQNGNERRSLLNEMKKMEAVLKLLRDGGKAGESENTAASDEALIGDRDVREVLIDSLKNTTSPSPVGVKRMGDVDCKPFYEAMKRASKKEDSLRVALNMCQLWTECVKDPQWRPFKVIVIKGKSVEVIDHGDMKLKALKKEMGEEVQNAVSKALTEMNEYDPIGRSMIPELWNFKKGRKASLKEVIAFLLNQSEQKKRARLLP
ncbi:hypothetical protein TorRG33x02_282940 [Trema orientale]|uniref:Factor of DNA methylation 1-5/IDN2 domain-containing protein n=1 Tax=Trema orientale TaxID=63057 RepID=A0A2P5CJ00_TREOI|nr:hypothetical protein TorRG33x02_282940 [Trema orientale]